MAEITKEIDGVTFKIALTPGGIFHTQFDGSRVEAPSLKGLDAKLKKLVRNQPVPVRVPLTMIDTAHGWRYESRKIKVTQITLVGSQASGKYARVALYVEDKHPEKKPETLNRYGRDGVYTRLEGPQIESVVALWNAYQAAQAAWESWCERNKVDALEALAKAQEELQAARQQQQQAAVSAPAPVPGLYDVGGDDR